MNPVDVRCERVSKRYRMPPRRDVRTGGVVGRAVGALWQTSEDFWALRDVSFDVAR